MSIANRTRTSGARTDATADGTLLRASVTLLIVGWLLLFVMSEFLHPGGGATFEATFANYAASGDWAAVHLGSSSARRSTSGDCWSYSSRSTSLKGQHAGWPS